MIAMECSMKATIRSNLDDSLSSNAIFMAERLVAQFPSESNLHLLATCYHRGGQTFRCYALLRGLAGPDARYLFAVCCIELGKLTEAEAVLLRDGDEESIPNGAAGVYLLGRVYQLSNRHSPAVQQFRRALQMDPLMWCAFEQLCALSPDVDAKAYLEMNPMTADADADAVGAGVGLGLEPGIVQHDGQYMTPVNAPVGSSAADVSMDLGTGMGHASMPLQTQRRNQPQVPSQHQTPGVAGATPVGSFETPLVAPQVVQPPPMKKGSKDSRDGSGNYTPMVSPILLSGSQFLGGRKFLDEGTVRKISSKLFSEPATALKIAQAHVDSPRERGMGGMGGAGTSGPMPTAGAGTGTGVGSGSGLAAGTRSAAMAAGTSWATGTTTSGTAGAAVASVRGPHSAAARTPQGQAACISLLQLLGEGYRFLSMYECEKAIEAFSKVPLPHYSTGWVLQCIGQAHFEMVDYHAAEKTFQQLRLLDPCRLEGLEVYSTVLWHMKKEVELSGLAQEAIALDRHSPVAWCIMGNCFSLQKEHETALRFFQRSLQLDPTFTYAYTLCGHEYFANEDFEKGINCYRNAIRLNPRHYNAWFGSGHIYFRQEKYGMAEYHFRRAHHINHRSSVLKCYLGMALHKLKRTGEAIQTLKQAVTYDPKNPLARFEYASVLASIGDLDKAVAELTILHSIVPREASVLFQKGKVLKRLGRQDEALKCFSDALDLQPPSIDTNLIKSAIDRISLEDDGEDDI